MTDKNLKLAIGSDHAGYELKEFIKEFLKNRDIQVFDVGTNDTSSCDYPVFSKKVVEKVLSKETDLGILVCGTGQGMAMCANKFKGIRAVVCSDTFSAHAAREHNNANILCLGQRVVGKYLALDIISSWLSASFSGGRHQERIDMFDN